MKTEKIRPFFAIVIILGVWMLCFFFGRSEFGEYFSFGQGVVFSWLSIFFVALPLVMVFPLFYFLLFFIKDERYATQYMERFVVYLKFLFVLIGVVSFAFIIIYKYELSERSYTSCNGIPSGWMPGMAKKYAIEPSLCNQH
ncbi:DUF1240 domain-containing protein [Enterobacter ludwigii]|uniref:DUF1240 domain-containing protein n=1 Tax=Enterobacter ludwigii TaxID=299767 RepID=UPI003975EF04